MTAFLSNLNSTKHTSSIYAYTNLIAGAKLKNLKGVYIRYFSTGELI